MGRLINMGERLKEQGRDRVEANNQEWIDLMRKWATIVCRHSGEVTTDELQAMADAYGKHPEHPNAWGAVFRGIEWQRVGFRKSIRPQARGRIISVWKRREHGQKHHR